jgi:hypothetical protein
MGVDNMNNDIKELEKRISNIEERNKRVEGDKAWETSTLRKILIIVLTGCSNKEDSNQNNESNAERMQSNITNNSNKTQNNVVEIKKNANGKC